MLPEICLLLHIRIGNKFWEVYLIGFGQLFEMGPWSWSEAARGWALFIILMGKLAEHTQVLGRKSLMLSYKAHPTWKFHPGFERQSRTISGSYLVLQPQPMNLLWKSWKLRRATSSACGTMNMTKVAKNMIQLVDRTKSWGLLSWGFRTRCSKSLLPANTANSLNEGNIFWPVVAQLMLHCLICISGKPGQLATILDSEAFQSKYALDM